MLFSHHRFGPTVRGSKSTELRDISAHLCYDSNWRFNRLLWNIYTHVIAPRWPQTTNERVFLVFGLVLILSVNSTSVGPSVLTRFWWRLSRLSTKTQHACFNPIKWPILTNPISTEQTNEQKRHQPQHGNRPVLRHIQCEWVLLFLTLSVPREPRYWPSWALSKKRQQPPQPQNWSVIMIIALWTGHRYHSHSHYYYYYCMLCCCHFHYYFIDWFFSFSTVGPFFLSSLSQFQRNIWRTCGFARMCAWMCVDLSSSAEEITKISPEVEHCAAMHSSSVIMLRVYPSASCSRFGATTTVHTVLASCRTTKKLNERNMKHKTVLFALQMYSVRRGMCPEVKLCPLYYTYTVSTARALFRHFVLISISIRR